MNSFQIVDEQYTSPCLASQLEDAAKVHSTLIPRSLPRVKGFRLSRFHHPSAPLHGDFYDFRPVQGGLLALVAHISGQPLEAALATMLVKHVFHETASSREGIVQILEEMNTQLYEALPGGMFVSASLVRITEDDAGLRVGNAGLRSGIRLCADSGGGYESVEGSGTPLGLLSDRTLAGYGEQLIPMNAGDVFVIASGSCHWSVTRQ
jgi:sigma-B regulation protein RsbU (phosphoserine phosphatase)